MTDCTTKRRRNQAPQRSHRHEPVSFSFGKDVTTTLVFDAEEITSDAGLVALREIDERLGLIDMAANRIEDLRVPDMVVHPVLRLLREAVYAYAAGYEDANDHTPLRNDPQFKQLIGKINEQSVNPKKQPGLASEATLSRLLGGRKLEGRETIGLVHVEQFAKVVGRRQPDVFTLGIDGYGAETHGMQQLALFNGFYDQPMYYPLHVTIAEYGFVVGVMLRPGSAGAGTDAAKLLAPIIAFLRKRFPKTKLRLRGDSGFADPVLYELCEAQGVEYVFRLKMNAVLKDLFAEQVVPRIYGGRADLTQNGQRIFFHEAEYQAKSWPHARRIVLKLVQGPEADDEAQYVIVTNSRKSMRNSWGWYEHRGQEEQRIDEFKNHLRGEKCSCCNFSDNAFKLHLVAMAHNLFAALRIYLPEGHELKRATVCRLRLTLVKCGAMVRRTARRLWLHASRHYPHKALLVDVCRRVTSSRLHPTPVWDSG